MIDNYMVSTSELSERRWTRIFEKCSTYGNDSEDKYAASSAYMMQNTATPYTHPAALQWKIDSSYICFLLKSCGAYV
jgi:hypothetical protein